jgi:hypothetical protein
MDGAEQIVAPAHTPFLSCHTGDVKFFVSKMVGLELCIKRKVRVGLKITVFLPKTLDPVCVEGIEIALLSPAGVVGQTTGG